MNKDKRRAQYQRKARFLVAKHDSLVRQLNDIKEQMKVVKNVLDGAKNE